MFFIMTTEIVVYIQIRKYPKNSVAKCLSADSIFKITHDKFGYIKDSPYMYKKDSSSGAYVWVIL